MCVNLTIPNRFECVRNENCGLEILFYKYLFVHILKIITSNCCVECKQFAESKEATTITNGAFTPQIYMLKE